MIPQLGKYQRNRDNRPYLKTTRNKRDEETVPHGQFTLTHNVKDIWDIGPGPWYYNGIKASRPEYLVLRELVKMGYHPKFQTDFMMGRSVKGGQVLDIILEDHVPPVYIDVRGYYHYGAAKSYNDYIKEQMVTQAMPGTICLVVWEKDVDQPYWLQNFLLQNVGVKGGR